MPRKILSLLIALLLLAVMVTPAYATGFCNPGRAYSIETKAVYGYKHSPVNTYIDVVTAKFRDLDFFVYGQTTEMSLLLTGTPNPSLPFALFQLTRNSSGNWKLHAVTTDDEGTVTDDWTNDPLPEQYGFNGSDTEVNPVKFTINHSDGLDVGFDYNLNGTTVRTGLIPFGFDWTPDYAEVSFTIKNRGNQFGGTPQAKWRAEDMAVQYGSGVYADSFTFQDNYSIVDTDTSDSHSDGNKGRLWRVWDTDC